MGVHHIVQPIMVVADIRYSQANYDVCLSNPDILRVVGSIQTAFAMKARCGVRPERVFLPSMAGGSVLVQVCIQVDDEITAAKVQKNIYDAVPQLQASLLS